MISSLPSISDLDDFIIGLDDLIIALDPLLAYPARAPGIAYSHGISVLANSALREPLANSRGIPLFQRL